MRKFVFVLIAVLCSVAALGAANRFVNTDILQFKQLSGTPATPAAGYNRNYFKSDGFPYFLTTANVETRIGDMIGAASSTDTAVPTFSGTGGKTLQNNTGVTISSNNLTVSGSGQFSDPLILAHEATPASPSAGFVKLYFKNDNALYRIGATGGESSVGGGSGAPVFAIVNGNGGGQSANVALKFPNEVADANGMYAAGTGQFTIPSGKTVCLVRWYKTGDGTGRILSVYLDNVKYLDGSDNSSIGSGVQTGSVTVDVTGSGTEVIDIRSSGTTTDNANDNASVMCW